MTEEEKLPEGIECKLRRIYETIAEGRGTAVDDLVRTHPEHAEAIRRRLERADARFADLSDDVPERIGPYRILNVLGEGGMGTVYKADQREPVRRLVALKVIKLGMDSKQVLARFDLERRALASMRHSSIAKVFDAGTTERGQPYFAMELVQGLPLTDYCDKHRLSLEERISLFQRICAGVQHAHQKGVIHRDLKPGNIIVEHEGEEAVPKILDFGLAKATNRDLVAQTVYTERELILGTPEYMAPEQAALSQEEIDTRADVYSLGVLLYELLSGALPFSSHELRQAGWGEMRRTLLEVDPPKPSTKFLALPGHASECAAKRGTRPNKMARDIRGDLDWIVLKAMSKEPERRYDSATALAMDLRRFLEHEPVVAGPPSVVYRLAKFARRYRGQVVAASIVVLSLLAGLVAFAVENARVRKGAEAIRQRGYLLAATAAAEQDPMRALLLVREIPPESELSLECLGVAYQAIRNSQGAWPVARISHSTLVNHGSFSPDGSRIVTVSVDGIALVWNADRSESPLVLKAPEGRFETVAWRLDGSAIVTTAGNVARVWNVDAPGEPVVCHGHEEEVVDAAFSPDGSRVVTVSADGTVRVWRVGDPGSSVTLRQFAECARFSPDGARIVTAGRDGLALCNADGTGERVILHEDDVRRADISPDGAHILITDHEGPARIVSTNGSGKHVVLDHPTATTFFSPDGLRVTTTSIDGTIRVWMTDGSAPPITIQGLEGEIAVAISPDGLRLLTRCFDGTARIRNVDGTGRPILLRGHESAIASAAFSPDGTQILTTSWDGTARLWSTRGPNMPVVLRGQDQAINAAAFSPDGTRLATASSDGTACIWNMNDPGMPVILDHDEAIVSAAFSPNGARLVTASLDGTAHVWSVSDSGVRVCLRGHDKAVVHAGFSPDGMRVVTASEDGTARIWNADGSGSAVVLSHQSKVGFATFSPDGQRIFTVSDEGIHLWRGDGTGPIAVLNSTWLSYEGPKRTPFSPDGSRFIHIDEDVDGPITLVRVRLSKGSEYVAELQFSVAVWAAEFSPDGTKVVVSTDNGPILWNADGTGTPIVFDQHELSYACINPAGSRLVTVSNDHFATSGDGRAYLAETPRPATVRIRNILGSGMPVDLHRGVAQDLAYSPDGSYLVGVSEQGTARLWIAEWSTMRTWLWDNVRPRLTQMERDLLLLGTSTVGPHGEGVDLRERRPKSLTVPERDREERLRLLRAATGR